VHGAWEGCRDRSTSCLPRTGVATSEGGTAGVILRPALLLRSVASLMLYSAR
jgi:hypothetical protein